MTDLPKDLLLRFEMFRQANYGPGKSNFRDLAQSGQSPKIMMVSCSDSRVRPDNMFSVGPGEIFSVRNVAGLVPPYETSGTYHGVSAAVEFAVQSLKVEHIIVLGHSQCGGVRAALDGTSDLKDTSFVCNWVSMLDESREAVLLANPGASHTHLAACLERASVMTSIRNLRSFPFVKEAEDAGHLVLHGAHFNIGLGALTMLDEATGEFTLPDMSRFRRAS